MKKAIKHKEVATRASSNAEFAHKTRPFSSKYGVGVAIAMFIIALTLYATATTITDTYISVNDEKQWKTAECVVDAGGNGDYTTVQECVNAISSGGTVYVKEGLHTLTTRTASSGKAFAIFINKENITIQCDAGAYLKRSDDLNVSAIIGETGTNNYHVNIKGCNIDCNYLNATYSSAGNQVYMASGIVQYSDYWNVQDNNIKNCGQYGGIVWHGGHGKITGNTIADTVIHNLSRQKYASCLMVTYLTAKYNIIADNICINPQGNGLFLEDNAEYNTVTNWQTYNSHFRGFSCETSRNNLINNLVSYNSGEIGMHINGCGYSQFNNIQVIKSGADAVWIADTITPGKGGYISLSNIVVLNATNDGIQVTDHNFTISDALIKNSGTIDLYLLNSLDYFINNVNYNDATLTGSTNRRIKQNNYVTGTYDLIGTFLQSGTYNLTGNSKQVGRFNLVGNLLQTGQQILTGNMTITNPSTANGLSITQNNNVGDATTTGALSVVNTNNRYMGVNFYSNSANPIRELVRMRMDNTNSTQEVLEIWNDGTGNSLFIDQNGNGIALNIDSEATTAVGVQIQNIASDKALSVESGDKICLNGATCSAYIWYNGTHTVMVG